MSSTTNPQPDQPDADALVAYLDGELPPEECRRVESRLASDAGYRQQMHDLDQAWEALSALPESRASDDFARTTMELVTVAAQGELKHDLNRAAIAKRHRAWQWSAAGLAAALIGFAGAWAVFARNERMLLDDLPVIRNVKALQQVENVAFLRELSATVPAQELARDEAAAKDDVQRLMLTGTSARPTRREWLDARPDDQKSQLSLQADRFYHLSRDERKKLRQRYQDILASQDSAKLQTTLTAYNQWLTSLESWQEEELRELATSDEKIDYIAREVRRNREQAMRRLSDDDLAKLREVVLAIAKERGPEFERQMRGRNENWLRRLRSFRNGFEMAVVMNDSRQEKTRDRLENALSDDARERLNQLSPIPRQLLLGRWIRDSLRPEWGPGELERYFSEELPIADRERLLQLPPGEMKSQLEQRYAAQYGEGADWWFGDRGGDGRWRPGQGRPDFPPEGRDMDRREGPPRGFQPDDPNRNRRRPPPPEGPGGPLGQPPGPRPRPNDEPQQQSPDEPI